MALPFLNSNTRKGKDQMVSIDLGGRITKAVHLQASGNKFVLSSYALLDAPIHEGSMSTEMLSNHIKSVAEMLNAKTKFATVTIGVNDSIVRPVEMPMMPSSDFRNILKLNSKTYLQQDFSGFVFDRYILPTAGGQSEKRKGDAMKAKMLLAGGKGRSVEDLSTAIKSAGLVADHVVPSLIGLVNSFEQALPEVHSKGVVALVDIGFKSSIICMIQEGELILSRVVNIGGDKLTQGLAELMNISYAEAEGIKVGMPAEVQSHLETLVAPLIRELRASIDFFEHQQDRGVSQIYLSGGSARSECLVETLQSGIGLECKNWNPAGTLELALASQQASEMEQVAPQLAVAIGAALTAL